jgi:transcriptional regulator with XRE-family HTH domain
LIESDLQVLAMARKTAPLLPKTERLLHDLGERLKLARLRRRFTAKTVVERAGMSVMTLRSLESGGAGVTIGAYLSVLQVLGLESDIARIAGADALGHQLEDARLLRNAGPKANIRIGSHIRPLPSVDSRRRQSSSDLDHSEPLTATSLASLLVKLPR